MIMQDRWNFQLTDSKQEEFFREIPIEDYVIKDGKLAGFYPYQGWKEQKGEVLAEKGVENVLWITLNRTEDMADNVLKFTKKTGEAYSPEGESCYKTFWRLYLYSSEGRLKRSNTAFRWDGKGTLAILGNMSMPYWEEDEFTPWDYYAAQVKNLIISSGITAITKKSFRNCKNIENIFLPATVEVVEQGAFDIRTQVCKLFAFAGSFSAVYQWNKNIEMVLLDIKKDAAWIQDKYGIDIEEEYHNYWKNDLNSLML